MADECGDKNRYNREEIPEEVKLVTSGSNLGIATPPLINFMMEIPAVMTRNTTARATDNADVYLKESAKKP